MAFLPQDGAKLFGSAVASVRASAGDGQAHLLYEKFKVEPDLFEMRSTSSADVYGIRDRL